MEKEFYIFKMDERKITKEDVERVYFMKKGFSLELSRAITTFLDEEIKLFDNSILSLVDKYPNLADRIEDIHLKMYLPVECTLEFVLDKLPVAELSLREKRNALANILAFLDQNPNLRRIVNKLVEAQEKTVKNEEELIEQAKQKLPIYLEFIERVFKNIESKVSERKIITFRDYSIEDVNIRNEIYKQCLSKNSIWLLGYDIKLTSKIGVQVTRDNAQRLGLYNSLDEQGKKAVSQGQFIMFFPSPLGAEALDGKKLHEEVLVNMIDKEPLEQYETLDKAIDEYFDKKAKQIFEID